MTPRSRQYGQPMMIDLADCDALLPSVFDIRPNRDFNADHRPYLFNSALISLSVLLGRILKAVYSPSGFSFPLFSVASSGDSSDTFFNSFLRSWYLDVVGERCERARLGFSCVSSLSSLLFQASFRRMTLILAATDGLTDYQKSSNSRDQRRRHQNKVSRDFTNAIQTADLRIGILYTPGYLHLLYIPVRFLYTRPFMRISFQLPERFASLSVGAQQWSVVEGQARQAIEWVDKHESCLEGWFVGTYSFFVCSLIQ
jgi:hypothetical protein